MFGNLPDRIRLRNDDIRFRKYFFIKLFIFMVLVEITLIGFESNITVKAF